MVRGIRLIGPVVGVALLLGAVSAASASAVELIRFTKTGAFSVKSTTKITLETNAGRKVECETATAKGKAETESLAVVLVLFEKCREPKFSTTCTSAGSPAGEIHISHMLVLLGSDEDPKVKDNPAMLLKPSEPEVTEFQCAGLVNETLKITGADICLVQNNAAKTGIELLCEKGINKGEQKDRKFWDVNQTNVEDRLLIEGKGAENFTNEEASLEASYLIEGTQGVIQIEVS